MDPDREDLLIELVHILSDEARYDMKDLQDLLGCLRQHQDDNARFEESTGEKRSIRLSYYLKYSEPEEGLDSVVFSQPSQPQETEE